MEALMHDVGQFVQEHRSWAAVIIALVSFGESLAFVGMVIPATALMIVIGGLAGAGLIDPVTVVLGAIIGAVLGDVVSYIIGRKLGPRIVYRPIFRRYRQPIARTRLLFRRYGFAAVFLGRFLSMFRNTVPLVAGMMAMSQTRFQLANISSAIIWAPLMLAPGYLGAKGFDTLGATGGGVTAFLTVGLLALSVVGVVALVRQLLRSEPRKRAYQPR